MSLGDPHPDMAAILEAQRAAAAPALESMPLGEARAQFVRNNEAWDRDAPAVEAEDAVLGGVACRVLGSARDRVVLFVHGGGWMFGSPATHDRFARLLAIGTRARVVVPDYRLAPEHPAPAAIDDVLAVIADLDHVAATDAKLVLSGDSAGANIALAAALERPARPIVLLSLLYGCFAPLFDTASHGRNGDGRYGLSTERMRWCWRNWLGPAADRRAAPLGRRPRWPAPLSSGGGSVGPALRRQPDVGGPAGPAWRRQPVGHRSGRGARISADDRPSRAGKNSDGVDLVRDHPSARQQRGRDAMITRRAALAGSAALMGAPSAGLHAQAPAMVRWWYHFDDPKATPDALIAGFEKQHPGIKIVAESIPWGGGGDYDTRLYTALIAGNGPDAAMVKFQNMPRLMEMDAILPIGAEIAAWAGRSDIADDLWKLHRAPDGKQYYLPLQYVILYLYVRQDWFAQKKLAMPTDFDSFLAGAKALTEADRWGFGMRGGSGGHDFWASLVLGNGATITKGGLVTPQALAANKWFIDLYRTEKVEPPSAPTDGFLQTINNMKAGRTAMTIHHIGSANDMVAALGDAVTAIPVPRGQGDGWATYGDGSNAVFSTTKNKSAAWAWISYLSTAEANAAFAKLSAQLPVTSSSLKTWNAQPRRFIEASERSLPIAHVLPSVTQTADFTRTVWPQTTQKAMLGQISPDEMMRTFDKLYFG